jgi:hypothetical protein
MFERLGRMFKGKVTKETLIRQLQLQAEVFDTEQAECNFKLKRIKSRIEGILNRGKEAANKSDTLGKRQAAMELKGVQMETTQAEKELMKVINARTFVQITLGRLERSGPPELRKAYHRLESLMKNSEFTRLMTEASYNSQEAQSKIAAAVDRVFDELPGEFNALSVDTNLFEELAEAERAGNVDRVRELKRKAGARTESSVSEDALV